MNTRPIAFLGGFLLLTGTAVALLSTRRPPKNIRPREPQMAERPDLYSGIDFERLADDEQTRSLELVWG